MMIRNTPLPTAPAAYVSPRAERHGRCVPYVGHREGGDGVIEARPRAREVLVA
jgi:hypothetical protein